MYIMEVTSMQSNEKKQKHADLFTEPGGSKGETRVAYGVLLRADL